MKTNATLVALNFTLFALFTSTGYVFYELLLRGISASVLIFNSFFWMFLFRVFLAGNAPRSPIKSVRTSIDSYKIVYAVSIFSYWYLFWNGIALIPQDNNASKTAVGLLALNTVLAPIASYFAVSKQERSNNILAILLIGVVLFLAIVLMESDSNAEDFSSRIYSLEHFFKAIIGSPVEHLSRAGERLVSKIDKNTSYLGAAGCFLAAIIFEAMGDYFNIRRSAITDMQYGDTLNEIYVTSAKISVLRNHIKLRSSMLKWVQFSIGELRNEIKIKEDLRSKASMTITTLNSVGVSNHKVAKESGDEYAMLCGQISSYNSELEDFLNIEDKIHINGAISVNKQERMRILRYIQDKHWSKAIKKISIEEKGEVKTWAKRFSDEAADDLLAIMGLFFSALSVISSLDKTGLRADWRIVGQLIGLIMVGALGSTARVTFINPLVRNDNTVLEVLPPVYAVRPIILFILMLFIVNKFSIPEYMSQFEIFGIIKVEKIDHNIGWLFGAILALLAAIAAWRVMFSVRR